MKPTRDIKHRRNTIALVEPHYCDKIVREHGVIEPGGLRDILAQVSGTEVRQSFVSTYRYFFQGLLNLYSAQDEGLVRNRRGEIIARQHSTYHRKFVWLLIVSQDEVFQRFFRFTADPRSKKDIAQKFNRASGKYLIRWGEWLGKTLYVPRLEKYQSFAEKRIPGQGDFWAQIVDAYDRLSRRSWIGPRRYGVAVGELRIEVCGEHSILPLTFDHLLASLYQSKQRYTELELMGLPPHRLEQRGRELSSITVDGSEYFYVVIHTQREFDFRR